MGGGGMQHPLKQEEGVSKATSAELHINLQLYANYLTPRLHASCEVFLYMKCVLTS